MLERALISFFCLSVDLSIATNINSSIFLYWIVLAYNLKNHYAHISIFLMNVIWWSLLIQSLLE